MTACRLTEGATLVLRVDDGPWQRIVSDQKSFPEAMTPVAGELQIAGDALAETIDDLDGVAGAVDGEDSPAMRQPSACSPASSREERSGCR